ncbi:MAG: tetratricopeptide repeat protein [Planctomycetes bacterium]|nr:tetratricopeptide repeat protein [Planctomycetota bacterium]
MEEYPDDVRGLIHQANVRRAQGDRTGALDAYKQALKRDPNNPLALWWKADYHMSEPLNPDLKQAQDALKRIVQVFSRRKDDVARQWVEQAKAKLRYCESRRLTLESHKFLKAKPGEAPSEKSLRRARELLAKARDVYPEDPRNHMNLGSVELQLKNPQAAIALCRAALERNASYARAHLILGHAFRATGQLKLAKDSFLSCIELDTLNRDKAEAWRARREVEQELSRYRRRFFNVLANRPGEDGEREPLELHRLKEWVGVLEGDTITAADLHRDPRGAYVLHAYGERHEYRALPGPEGLFIERV